MAERANMIERIAEKYNIDYEDVDNDYKLTADAVKKIAIYHGISTWDKGRKQQLEALLEDSDIDQIFHPPNQTRLNFDALKYIYNLDK